MKQENKIIVAHPLQQHSYKTAEALAENGILNSYITTVYYEPQKKIYKFLGRILGSKNATRMINRKNKTIEKFLRKYNEMLGIIYLFIVRIDKTALLSNFCYSILTRRFGKNIKKFVNVNKDNINALIMYDKTAYTCFKSLKREKNEIIKIMDMSSSAAPYIRDILTKELNKSFPNFKKSIKRTLREFTKRNCKKYQQELEDTDYFLVPSIASKKSLVACGVKEEKIRYIPYGVNIEQFNLKQYDNPEEKPLEFLFVGRIEAAKGIYYLLEAFKKIHVKANLHLIGKIPNKDKKLMSYLQNNTDHIFYEGSKRKDEMPDSYKKADVLIMPSLYEGLSLTIFEAMSVGLPVIATKNAGVENIIQDGKEGFVIESNDIDAIKNKIEWFCSHKTKIPEMGKQARKLAEKYTWENYKKNLVENLQEIIQMKE